MRLIDLDDDRNCFCGSDGEYEKWNIDPEALAEARKEARAAFGLKPKKGKWIHGWICSECGEDYHVNGEFYKWNFCPNCGVPMAGRVDEETEEWHSLKGNIEAPKGTFDKIYEEEEE